MQNYRKHLSSNEHSNHAQKIENEASASLDDRLKGLSEMELSILKFENLKLKCRL